MIAEALSNSITGLLTGGSGLAFPVVAAAGFVSTLKNPCAVPLYPAATSVCVGRVSSGEVLPAARNQTSLLSATAFVVGMAISIAVLGVAAAAAGRVIGIGRGGRYLVALLPIVMGLHRLGWIRIPALKFKFRRTFRPGLVGAFGTGFLLSLVIGRCGGAVLGTILAYAAYHEASLYGGVLLFAYGLGAGLPLITFGAAVGKVTTWIETKGYQKWTERAMAGTMLALGFYLLWLV